MVRKRDADVCVRTVGCRLDKLIIDPTVVDDIREIVKRVHHATVFATELLNLHLRRALRDDLPLRQFFDKNWLVKAFYEVTVGSTNRAQRDAGLTATCDAWMSPHSKPSRDGMHQLYMANCNMLATCAKNNVWMQFRKRLLSHVRRVLPDQEQYATRQEMKLQALRVVQDLCTEPSATRSSNVDEVWYRAERERLLIDAAMQDDWSVNINYALKKSPERFLKTMAYMSSTREAAGKGAFSLYPLRRALVPRHVRFDKKSFHDSIASLRRARKQLLGKRPRVDGEEDIADEITFESLLDYKRAGVHQRHLVKDGFTTDGVCARVQQNRVKPSSNQGQELPRRGLWTIDELKRRARDPNDLHVVGVDPGKRELVVATDMERPESTPVRYTLRQRQYEMRTRAMEDEHRREVPFEVSSAIEDASQSSSRTASLEGFADYCRLRHEGIDVCLHHYGYLPHRARRWKTYIRSQVSEEMLYKRIEKLRTADDSRPLCLAYGSWGLVAGRVGACNKGNPPCIGVGLMRKLSKRFLVAMTPEQYTSKICRRCDGLCGAHPTLRSQHGTEIRGLRLCQQNACSLLQNRDRTGSYNIGRQFNRLFQGLPPLRALSSVEEEMTLLQCGVCDS